MEELKTKARELLANKEVQVVIGYTESPLQKIRPAFIQDPTKVDTLIYDERCKQNLAVYLLRREIKKLGKPAIVATVSVMRSIIQLASELQITEKDVVVLGISPDKKLLTFNDFASLEKYIKSIPLKTDAKEKEMIEKLNKMTLEERWAFWTKELSRCFKCYACRAACPMCYCTKCTVECNQPQWIPVGAHELGNLEWHVMRAMHLAGRCVNCHECGRACPLEIPIHLLTQKLSEDIAQEFGLKAGTSLTNEYALSMFKPEDKENFIK